MMLVGRGHRRAALALLVCSALLLAGCGSSADSSDEEAEDSARTTLIVDVAKREPKVPLPKGEPSQDLVVEDLESGWGVAAREGDVLTTKFVAKYADGRPFESSWDPGEQPFSFQLGAEESSPGWEEGLRGMRVGGQRLLIVPPDMASRFGPLPPGDTLVYVVELIGVAPPELKERKEPKVSRPPGAAPEDLRVRDLIKGKGVTARRGNMLTIEYVAITYDGTRVVNSWKKAKPVRFELGADDSFISPGWEEGLPGMRVGGRRELVVPPELQPVGVPPDSQSLVYVIDLIGITEPDDARR